MTLQEFATRYRLKIRKDSCGDEIIPGRPRPKETVKRSEDYHHIYEHGGRFVVFLTFDTKARWNSARQRLLSIGAQNVARGDTEGMLGFDPNQEALVRLVFKLARIRIKRQLTEEQKTKIRERFTHKEKKS